MALRCHNLKTIWSIYLKFCERKVLGKICSDKKGIKTAPPPIGNHMFTTPATWWTFPLFHIRCQYIFYNFLISKSCNCGTMSKNMTVINSNLINSIWNVFKMMIINRTELSISGQYFWPANVPSGFSTSKNGNSDVLTILFKGTYR